MAIKFEINMTNKWLYSLIAVGIILALGVGVWAYNSGGLPSIMGHSAEEIEGIPITKLIRHSLTASAPGCPAGWNKLWDGYSYAGGFLSEGFESGQILGGTGSCLETFAPIPFIECSSPDSCDYYTGNDYAMWLTTKNTDQSSVSGIDNIKSSISRCSVCEKPAPILVRHSFTTSAPGCPAGWNKLWDGYSYAGGFLSTGYGSGQTLGDTGSCLETFAPIPVIECGSLDTCDYYTGNDYAMWLTTKNTDQSSVSGIDNIKSSISRCSVCSK
jgi:integrin beta 8